MYYTLKLTYIMFYYNLQYKLLEFIIESIFIILEETLKFWISSYRVRLGSKFKLHYVNGL